MPIDPGLPRPHSSDPLTMGQKRGLSARQSTAALTFLLAIYAFAGWVELTPFVDAVADFAAIGAFTGQIAVHGADDAAVRWMHWAVGAALYACVTAAILEALS